MSHRLGISLFIPGLPVMPRKLRTNQPQNDPKAIRFTAESLHYELKSFSIERLEMWIKSELDRYDKAIESGEIIIDPNIV